MTHIVHCINDESPNIKMQIETLQADEPFTWQILQLFVIVYSIFQRSEEDDVDVRRIVDTENIYVIDEQSGHGLWKIYVEVFLI